MSQNDATITFRLTHSERALLVAESERRGVSLSKLLREKLFAVRVNAQPPDERFTQRWNVSAKL